MTSKAQEILQQALQLDPDERTELAHQLWFSLAPEEGGEDPKWEAELRRRLEDVRSGTAQSLSWPEVKAQILDPERPRRRR